MVKAGKGKNKYKVNIHESQWWKRVNKTNKQVNRIEGESFLTEKVQIIHIGTTPFRRWHLIPLYPHLQNGLYLWLTSKKQGTEREKSDFTEEKLGKCYLTQGSEVNITRDFIWITISMCILSYDVVRMVLYPSEFFSKTHNPNLNNKKNIKQIQIESIL